MSLLIREHDIQKLSKFYSLPSKVNLWLSDPKTYNPDYEFEFHEHLCMLHPEDALICIALCGHAITQHAASLPQINFSELEECVEYLLTDYGHSALKRMKADAEPDDECDIHGVATDLTKLSRILEELEAKVMMSNAEMLCTVMGILSIQAGAQADVARYVLSNLWQEQEHDVTKRSAPEIPFYSAPPANDNPNMGTSE